MSGERRGESAIATAPGSGEAGDQEQAMALENRCGGIDKRYLLPGLPHPPNHCDSWEPGDCQVFTS